MSKSGFTGYEEDDRGARGLPNRRHFRFFYREGIGNSILLDVVEENKIPHKIITKPIQINFLEIEQEVSVRLPTVESLLVDKLAAFAPKTIGILFDPPNKRLDPMQIMKQLFDVGELFSVAEDLNEIRETYAKVFELENGYRGSKYQMTEALQDSLIAALTYSLHNLKGIAQNQDALIMEEGRRNIRSHLVNHKFDLIAAKEAASKVGLLAKLILSSDTDLKLADLKAPPELETLHATEIGGDWATLNRLRASNPPAFYYWWRAGSVQ